MFDDLLYHLRAQGVPVGTGEWLAFLGALRRGLVRDAEGLYRVGRAVLCRSEADYDAFDLAFAKAMEGLQVPEDLAAKLEAWLAEAAAANPDPPPAPEIPPEDLWKELLDRLRRQKGRHDGGNHWIGTGGTSPFGHSGHGPQGIRIGGPGGGGRALQVAMERRWQGYRGDRQLDIRELQVALRALRTLRREGRPELDLDATIDATCHNAGEIELVERPERRNQVHLVLLMDAGGSMAPHAERVERLFTAASRVRTFRTFQTWEFHNCVYGHLYRDIETGERVPTGEVLEKLSPRHRLLFVGDASMAPHELFSAWGWRGQGTLAGIDWLRRLRERCPASAWLNPDPPRWWRHPTVSAIGRIFPMFELTVDGLQDAVRRLRAPV